MRPTREQRRRMAVRTSIAAALVLAAALIDSWLRPPVSLFGLTGAVVLLAYWRTYIGLARHHLIAAGAIAAASFLGLFIDRGAAWGICS